MVEEARLKARERYHCSCCWLRHSTFYEIEESLFMAKNDNSQLNIIQPQLLQRLPFGTVLSTENMLTAVI